MRRGKNSSEAAGGESMQYGYSREGLRLSNPVVKTRRQKTLYFWRYRKKSKIQKSRIFHQIGNGAAQIQKIQNLSRKSRKSRSCHQIGNGAAHAQGARILAADT